MFFIEYRRICVLLQQRIFIRQPQNSLFWFQPWQREPVGPCGHRFPSHGPNSNWDIFCANPRVPERHHRLSDTSQTTRGNFQRQCRIFEWASSILVHWTGCYYPYCLAYSSICDEKLFCWEKRSYLKGFVFVIVLLLWSFYTSFQKVGRWVVWCPSNFICLYFRGKVIVTIYVLSKKFSKRKHAILLKEGIKEYFMMQFCYMKGGRVEFCYC